MIILDIQNFQKITEAKINIKGFSIVRGESNLGKSSIARAIDSVVFGGYKGVTETKSGYLKKGAKECVISLNHNGNKITIVKSKTKNQYIINGIDLPKGGRGVPEQVRELGYRVLPNGVNLNVAKQHSPLFIIGETETDITKSINSVFKVQLFEVAISKILKNKKETAIKEALLEEQAKQTTIQIAKLEELECLLKTKQMVENDIDTLDEYEEDITKLKEYTETNSMLINIQSYIRRIDIINEYELNTVNMKILTEAVEPINAIINSLVKLEQIEDFIMDKEELIEANNTKANIDSTVELLSDIKDLYYYFTNKDTLEQIKQDKSDTDLSLLEITKKLRNYTCKSCKQIIYGNHR